MKNIFILHLMGGIKSLRELLFSIIPYIPSRHLKNWLWRLSGVKMGRNVKFIGIPKIRNPKGLSIGDGVSIGPGVLLDARKGLIIHENAVIAYEAVIWSLNHDYNDIHFCGKGALTEIGANCWICSRSMIMPGIHVGDGAVVAAGAIVTKDIPPYTIVAGIPARPIGIREKKEWDYGYQSRKDYTHFL